MGATGGVISPICSLNRFVRLSSCVWTHSSAPVVPAGRRAAAGRESEAGCGSEVDAGGRPATAPAAPRCLCAPEESLLAA